jgi:hypothetical protein
MRSTYHFFNRGANMTVTFFYYIFFIMHVLAKIHVWASYQILLVSDLRKTPSASRRRRF